MSLQIAKTILQQIGSGTFICMTGAKNFMALDNGLQFDLPNDPHFVKDGINRIEIHLDPTDTYTMMAFRKKGEHMDLIRSKGGLYWDMLQPAFTIITGLDTYI